MNQQPGRRRAIWRERNQVANWDKLNWPERWAAVQKLEPIHHEDMPVILAETKPPRRKLTVKS